MGRVVEPSLHDRGPDGGMRTPAAIGVVHRRRRSDPDGPTPNGARWSLDLDPGFRERARRDPYVEIVRETIADFAAGHADRASRHWHDGIVWRVAGAAPMCGEYVGADRIFDYHRRLKALTEGTFRQRLRSLEASGGPIVDAYLRTTAERAGARLDIPTLLVFELAAGHIRVVSEFPGDQAAWDRFWSV